MSGSRLFAIVILIGLVVELSIFYLLEKIIGKPFKTNHRYSFGKHASLMSIPIYGLIALVINGNFDYVQLFLIGALVGTLAEFLAGKFFHIISGERVWTYKYLSLKGYTSLFAIPYWGGATLLFVALARLID
jgi:hypothetical protein